MVYKLFVSSQFVEEIKKFKMKDPLQYDIIKGKISEILENPIHHPVLQEHQANIHAVRLRHDILVYEVLEKENVVRILDCKHMDRIYRK